MKLLSKFSVYALLFLLVTSVVIAQQTVHALSGTVTTIQPKIAMITMTMDDGSSGHFQYLKKSDGAVDFDRKVSADATAADRFAMSDARVIVYYFGDGELRTAVALHDLGRGPIEKKSGAVVKFNRHEHVLTIKNSKGAEESFHVDPRTVMDTATGVEQNFKFDFSKGDQVRVLTAMANGSEVALLITPLM